MANTRVFPSGEETFSIDGPTIPSRVIVLPVGAKPVPWMVTVVPIGPLDGEIGVEVLMGGTGRVEVPTIGGIGDTTGAEALWK